MEVIYQKCLENYAKELGIDLSVWRLISDVEHEEDHRELIYQNDNLMEYALYAILQNFKNEWMVVELSIAGD